MPKIDEKPPRTPPKAKNAERVKEPLWKGPYEDGITFSLLSRFLVCRERFRLLAIEGLTPADSFNHRLEFGSMWHLLEEALARGELTDLGRLDLYAPLRNYAKALGKKYPTSGEAISKWFNVVVRAFPVYVDYWKKHPDVTARKSLLSEYAFRVPYTLPSGRIVTLRGKFDSVDLVGKGKGASIVLVENKTKGEVNEDHIKRQLSFDLQTMLYLVALEEYRKIRGNGKDSLKWSDGNTPISGVRYNVVRRPLSGGKGNIKRREPSKSNPLGESEAEYYDRLAAYIEEEPETYFFRFNVSVRANDIRVFRTTALDPILENLVDWYEWVTTEGDHFGRKTMRIEGATSPIDMPNATHWRHPFGVFNPMDSGGESDLDEYLNSGSTAGLRRATTLFPELEDSCET